MTKQHDWPHEDRWPTEDFARLYCLIYWSHATAGVDESTIAQIVSEAGKSNANHGITGLLVFDHRFFIQCLEGPKEQIESLMSRIRQDPRHTQVFVLSDWEDVRERLFPDWAMEWVSADHIRDVLLKALDAAKDTRKIEALRFLLEDFNSGTLATLTMH